MTSAAHLCEPDRESLRSECRIPSRTRAVRGMTMLAIVLAIGLALSSCATMQQERHLAPLFTQLSTAGGGTEIEAFAGAVRLRRARVDGRVEQWAMRPIFIHDRKPAKATETHFLTPFGTSVRRGEEVTWQLLPISRYNRHLTANGQVEWRLITLPGIYWSKLADGRIVRAWFPFGGVFEDFLSFDRLVFVLFPLYARSERNGRITYHFLFPVFAYTHGAGGPSWRFWPLYGRNKYEGRYDRFFVLWPIFHYHKDFIGLSPDKVETKWMLFPLIGREKHGTYRATSILWPFFGFARDPSTEFWSWDGPWPLVRIHRSPAEDTRRTRFWPFYSHFHGTGEDSTWYLWPIVNIRHSEYEKARKDSTYVIPFWQSWDRTDTEAGRSSFRKLWPLFQVERVESHTVRTAFPALNPLWRTPEIDAMYAWIYELYTRERDHTHTKERSWLGLWRREKDELEDRRSFAGIWARRTYRAGSERVAETSILFGLIRWRSTESEGLELLPPAIPGPGWPLERSGPSLTESPALAR